MKDVEEAEIFVAFLALVFTEKVCSQIFVCNYKV